MGIKKYLSLDKLDLFYEKLKTKMSSDNASTLASAKDYTNQELVDFAGEMNEAIDLLDAAIGSKASQSDLTALQTTVNGKANVKHNHAISDVTNLQAQLDSKADTEHTHTIDAELSSTSTNPIQNKVVQSAIKQLQDSKLDKDDLTTIQTDLSTHTSDKSNPHGVTASQVGLGNVNNTSDANKPVSTAQATAIADAKKAGTDAQADIDAHIANKSNPHGVTASQVGADPAGSASAVQTNLDVVEDKIDDHIADSNIHFTSAERTKLSNLNNYSHPNSGVTAGTYRSVTVDSQGHVKSGSNPTTLAGYGITDAEKAGAVNTHNISDSSHSDIRSLINELATKVNNFLDVDDKTKDQLSELISLIEANKTDIESITSGKVNVSDIVNNLVTNLSDKPLSAAQGVELKILIDGLQAVVNAHETNTGNPHGVTASQIGLGNVDNTSDENKPVSTAQAKAIADAKEVGTEAKVNLEAHTADKSNPHGITKAQINLGNVDNTSDADKPVSTLQATAIADAKKAGTDAQANLSTHTGNKANPHGVTKEQIDLGNVPNVTTNNQTPTYTVASANAELKSGETLSTAFGKIAKAISSLISHLGNKSNPHGVTKSQVGLGNVDNTADVNKSVKHATTSDTASTATTLTGLTATVAELNKLDGVTATSTELNYTDGVTSNIQTQLDGKQTTISGAATTITGSNLTANRALISNGSGKVAISAVTSTELGYLDGVTSAIQTQLDGKQATVTGGASTITGSNLTASRALVSDGNGKVAVSAVTSTELGYLDGVTSAIQTQLNGKASTSVATTSANGLMSTTDKSKLNATNMAYGTCSTAAATAAKVVTVSGNTNWALVAGSFITVVFSETNTASNPTLNVNGTGAKNVFYNGTQITTSSLGMAGTISTPMTFMYDGTQYIFTGWGKDNNTTYTNVKLGHGYATCSTAESTAAKVATLSSYTLTTGGIVAVKFTNAVPAGATLNINSKGAKDIYHRGAAIKAGVIKAGDTATFIYSSKYHLISIDRDDDTVVTLSSLGVTATAAELNKLDGVTATTAELNYVDGVTSNIQTQLNGKAASGHTHTAADVGAVPLNGTGGVHNIKTYNILSTVFNAYTIDKITLPIIWSAMEDNSIFMEEFWAANCTSFEFPPDLSSNYILLVVEKGGSGYGNVRLYDLVANAVYEQSKYGDVWTGWKKAFYADGSVAAKALNLNSGVDWCGLNIYPSDTTKMFRIMNGISGNELRTQFVNYTNISGGTRAYLQLDTAIENGVANIDDYSLYLGNDTKTYRIFGEHNKPSGEYTGNGSATTRYINIPVNCSAVLIRRSGTTDGTETAVIAVMSNGGFGKSGTTVKSLTNQQIGIGEKQLIITTNDAILNANGVVYKYHVLY